MPVGEREHFHDFMVSNSRGFQPYTEFNIFDQRETDQNGRSYSNVEMAPLQEEGEGRSDCPRLSGGPVHRMAKKGLPLACPRLH